MTRIVQGANGAPVSGGGSTNFVGGAAAFQGIAAAPFALNDIAQAYSTGRLGPVKNTDYAAAANFATAIATPTFTNDPQRVNPGGSNSVQGPDGSIYTVATVGAGSDIGMVLMRRDASGNAVQSATVENTVGPSRSANIAFLSNGNLFITWAVSGNAFYAIYNPIGLVQVVAATALQSSNGSSGFVASCPLSAGGFAAVYNTSAGVAVLAVYNNAGALQNTVNITTTSTDFVGIVQLSNGNIAVAYQGAGAVYFVATYTTAPAVAVAGVSTGIAQTTGTNYNGGIFLSVVPGYLAVAGASGTASACKIFSNALVAQGSPVAGGLVASSGVPTWQVSLTNDGTNFWFTYLTATAYGVVKVTTAGVSTAMTFAGSYGINTVHWSYWDFSTGTLVSIFMGQSYTVFDPATSLTTGVLLIAQTIPGTSNVSSNMYYASGSKAGAQYSALPLSDGTFWQVAANASSSGLISVWKTMDSAIIGAVSAAAATGAKVSGVQSVGGFLTNALNGSAAKTFDHTAKNIIGRKGQILNGFLSIQA